MKVIIDNGHGENTPGKRSPDGMLTSPGRVALYEFEFNRDIACRLALLLQANGLEPHMLVPEFKDVSLGERSRRANEVFQKDKESFLVSIHGNAFNEKASGFEVYTYVGQSESDTLAEFMCIQAKADLPFRMRFDTSDGDLDKESRFYILKHTKCPAILTESGFMDNPKDLAFMISDEGRQKIAETHLFAIIEFLKNRKE